MMHKQIIIMFQVAMWLCLISETTIVVSFQPVRKLMMPSRVASQTTMIPFMSTTPETPTPSSSSSSLLFVDDKKMVKTTSPNVLAHYPMQMDNKDQLLQMISFYKFVSIKDPTRTRNEIYETLSNEITGIRGTFYVAPEGINAQLAIPMTSHDDDSRLKLLIQLLQPHGLFTTNSERPTIGKVVSKDMPTFDKFMVRTRDYILRDGIKNNTTELIFKNEDATLVGQELTPQEWHESLSSTPSSSSSSSLLLYDCRNDYESDQGMFQNAIPLNTSIFSDTWDVLQHELRDHQDKSEPIYIYCTGGIRCVKVGAYLQQEMNFTNVKRLKDGIIGYQKWVNNQENNDENNVSSLWQGENFLFDKRRFAETNNDNEEQDLAP